jgi:hypothetical protein
MIDYQRLRRVFSRCLSAEGGNNLNAIVVEGPMGILGFHSEYLIVYEAEIISMLEQLPVRFRASQSGDGSFLGAPDVRDDSNVEENRRMEQLFYLGMAIGKVHCLLPNEQWYPLPGKTPYYRYLDNDPNGKSSEGEVRTVQEPHSTLSCSRSGRDTRRGKALVAEGGDVRGGPEEGIAFPKTH